MRLPTVKRLIANPNERRFYSKTYAIGNEYGILALVYANDEQDALDISVDSGKLDSMLMSADDFAEYEREGWDDCYIFAGNASEPVCSQYLVINEITRG